jgi:hypothetical protein
VIGCAYVYSREPNTLSWSSQQQLLNSQASTWAGKVVGIYETTILVSKTGDSMDAGENNPHPTSPLMYRSIGAVLVYNGDLSTGWSQSALLVASDRFQSDYFGWALSLFQNTVAIGAYSDDDKGSSSGHSSLTLS